MKLSEIVNLQKIQEAKSFPARLENGSEIAKYLKGINRLADVESLEEQFSNCYATLQTLKVADLKMSPSWGEDLIDRRRLKKQETNLNTPPILVSGYDLIIGGRTMEIKNGIMDGHHRLLAAKKRGDETIQAYVVSEKSR